MKSTKHTSALWHLETPRQNEQTTCEQWRKLDTTQGWSCYSAWIVSLPYSLKLSPIVSSVRSHATPAMPGLETLRDFGSKLRPAVSPSEKGLQTILETDVVVIYLNTADRSRIFVSGRLQTAYLSHQNTQKVTETREVTCVNLTPNSSPKKNRPSSPLGFSCWITLSTGWRDNGYPNGLLTRGHYFLRGRGWEISKKIPALRINRARVGWAMGKDIEYVLSTIQVQVFDLQKKNDLHKTNPHPNPDFHGW